MKSKSLTILGVVLASVLLTSSAFAQSIGWDNSRIFVAAPICFGPAITATSASASPANCDVAITRSAAGVLKFTTNDLSTVASLNSVKFSASVAGLASFNMPTGVVPTTTVAGDFYVPASGSPSIARVAASNEALATTLFSLSAVQAATATGATVTGSTQAITAGLTNVAGRTVEIEGWGVNTNVTGTPTVALAFKVGATTVATCTSTAVTNTVVAVVHFKIQYVVQVVGASGNDIAHCELTFPLASASGVASTFVDANTAVTSNYDHTIANNFTILFTSAGASNTFTLHTLVGNIKG